MGRALSLRCVLALGLMLAGIVAPIAVAADEDTKKKETTKEKESSSKDKSGVEWIPLVEITAKAPAVANATYAASKEFTITEKALRVKVKITSNEGKGGNMAIILHKLGKPARRTTIMKANRDGEKEILVPVEPGEYKIEINVNNVTATATIEQGRKSK